MSSAHDEQTSEIMIMQQLRIIQEGQQRMQEEQQKGRDQLQQRIDERFAEQLRIMQKEQQAGVEKLQQHMDEQPRSMQDSVAQEMQKLRGEMQQESMVLRDEMQQLRSEQSTLKAQVIAIINNTEKLDGQMLAKAEAHVQLQQQSSKLQQEMGKLRGNEVQPADKV